MRKIGINSVTVTSPVIAKFFKANFEALEVRASVNMEIGTPEGMDYLTDSFDSFYNTSSWEIRTFDIIHKFFNGNISVVN